MRHAEKYPQKPAGIASAAQRLCEARLICDNDVEFMNSSMLYNDVGDALNRAGCRGILLRAGRQRLVAGFWVERYGTLPAHYESASPWYDSHYDPTDPRQVVTAKISAEDMDAILSGYPSHAAKVKAMTECYGTQHTSVGEWHPNIQAVQKEPTVANPTPIKIETRVFIDGVQASGFTIDQLHQKVREQEAVINDLKKIENKSKKLAAEIYNRYESINALNAYIDGLPD